MIRPADADTGAAEPSTLAPVRPDEMVCIWTSATCWEWIVGPTLADELLNGGMEKINGQPVRVQVVDRPKLGGIHIRATMTEPVQC